MRKAIFQTCALRSPLHGIKQNVCVCALRVAERAEKGLSAASILARERLNLIITTARRETDFISSRNSLLSNYATFRRRHCWNLIFTLLFIHRLDDETKMRIVSLVFGEQGFIYMSV
jgi:hypothetical protein